MSARQWRQAGALIFATLISGVAGTQSGLQGASLFEAIAESEPLLAMERIAIRDASVDPKSDFSCDSFPHVVGNKILGDSLAHEDIDVAVSSRVDRAIRPEFVRVLGPLIFERKSFQCRSSSHADLHGGSLTGVLYLQVDSDRTVVWGDDEFRFMNPKVSPQRVAAMPPSINDKKPGSYSENDGSGAQSDSRSGEPPSVVRNSVFGALSPRYLWAAFWGGVSALAVIGGALLLYRRFG